MTKFGYTLFSELNGPLELVEQAVSAEDAGFDFLGISDHFHPWLSSHTDSPFAWSVLGAVAERTSRVGLMTLVTCPYLRYHPAIVAQAAATVQVMSGGRFTLGVGAGEELNEHVVGLGWPPVDVRHDMLTEAIEACRLLWQEGFHTYRGEYVVVEDARLFTLPDAPPDVLVAGSGPASRRLAVEHGQGLVLTEPDADLVKAYRQESDGRVVGQFPVAYDTDQARAEDAARQFSFGIPGWKVMAELPSVTSFDALVAALPEDATRETVTTGPDPGPYVETAQQWVEAGVDEIAIVNVGADREAFIRFFSDELRSALPTGA
jgi:G6PDH family F420-dependent oxidoreductase